MREPSLSADKKLQRFNFTADHPRSSFWLQLALLASIPLFKTGLQSLGADASEVGCDAKHMSKAPADRESTHHASAKAHLGNPVVIPNVPGYIPGLPDPRFPPKPKHMPKSMIRPVCTMPNQQPEKGDSTSSRSKTAAPKTAAPHHKHDAKAATEDGQRKKRTVVRRTMIVVRKVQRMQRWRSSALPAQLDFDVETTTWSAEARHRVHLTSNASAS